MNDELLPLPIEIKDDSIIKVMGVGGGGCNAVNYMYRQGITGVTFLVCNTDKQVLEKSSVPAKLQLGPGLGAGGNPEKAHEYAEASRDRIHEALDDGTQMLFITAGMGGGTGTGASATIAEVAQDMDILTVGIVTIPFAFEGKKKIRKALTGVARLAEHVDAILIINNEKLKQIYKDLDAFNAFNKSDDVVCNAAKSIAEIITIPGYINTDFADVYNTLKNGNVAIMNVGQAEGEHRITKAIDNALKSPLANASDVHGAKRILLQFYCSTENAIIMDEFDQINQFVEEVGDEVEVQWGVSIDDSLGAAVRVTIIATGYAVSDIPSLQDEVGKVTVDEAIESNYAGLTATEKPKEDEKPAQIDLTPVVGNDIIPASPRTQGSDAETIEISFDDEDEQQDKPAEEQPKQEHRRFGWIRGK
jgi:cell division protein FtsZ